MISFRAVAALTMILGACKPPPTDADLARSEVAPEESFASAPVDSPDTEGAMWAPSAEEGRYIYGIPGQPVLLSMQCLDETQPAAIRLTRITPADEGASALLALIGNGAIGRLPVEATEIGGRSLWQGEAPAQDIVWEPLAGPRQFTVTVPGGGLMVVNPGRLPEEFLSECRASGQPDQPDPQAAPE